VAARTIYYIDKQEESLDREVEEAPTRTPEQNLDLYCEVVAANYAMMGIDVLRHPVERKIYYLDDEGEKR
jgi:hypothetical protein